MSLRIIVGLTCFTLAVITALTVRKRQMTGKSVTGIFEVTLLLLWLVSLAMFNYPKHADLLMAPLPSLAAILWQTTRKFKIAEKITSEQA